MRASPHESSGGTGDDQERLPLFSDTSGPGEARSIVRASGKPCDEVTPSGGTVVVDAPNDIVKIDVPKGAVDSNLSLDVGSVGPVTKTFSVPRQRKHAGRAAG